MRTYFLDRLKYITFDTICINSQNSRNSGEFGLEGLFIQNMDDKVTFDYNVIQMHIIQNRWSKLFINMKANSTLNNETSFAIIFQSTQWQTLERLCKRFSVCYNKVSKRAQGAREEDNQNIPLWAFRLRISAASFSASIRCGNISMTVSTWCGLKMACSFLRTSSRCGSNAAEDDCCWPLEWCWWPL